MGAEYIDYIIADEVIIPKNNFKYYSEKVLYLPDCYQANMSQKDISKKNLNEAILVYQIMHLYIVALIIITKLHLIYLIFG